MSYIEDSLTDGEELKYKTKLHWVIFVDSVGAIALSFLITQVNHLLAAFVLMAGVIVFVIDYLDYLTSEFGITNKRLIMKKGFIARMTHEIGLEKIESLDVSQSIFGRIFNYGTIFVNGTGTSSKPFKEISRPLEFKKQLQK
jgi:uncharacterized membrane protein YdbT with pleckstrin-like domain